MATLSSIKSQCRQRADMENSNFISDSELTNYINNSISELHDLLIQSFGDDYYVESLTFSGVSGQNDYPLPNGTNYSGAKKFYKLKGVDVRNGSAGQWLNVKRFNFNKRNSDADSMAFNLLGNPFMEYRLVGSNIKFNRNIDSSMEFQLWYHPVSQVLTLDADEYDDINGYIEYVIIDAAIKMMQKEESDVSVLAAQKAAIINRIVSSAANRDANEPESVTDIYADDSERWFRLY